MRSTASLGLFRIGPHSAYASIGHAQPVNDTAHRCRRQRARRRAQARHICEFGCRSVSLLPPSAWSDDISGRRRLGPPPLNPPSAIHNGANLLAIFLGLAVAAGPVRFGAAKEASTMARQCAKLANLCASHLPQPWPRPS